jgi:hypothetical protein
MGISAVGCDIPETHAVRKGIQKSTWFCVGTHWLGMTLRKKALRKGFKGGIHTAADG